MTTRAHVTSILKEIDADGNLVEFLRHISAYLSWKLTPPWWKRKESVKERAMQMDIVANLLDVINLQYLGVSFYGFSISDRPWEEVDISEVWEGY